MKKKPKKYLMNTVFVLLLFSAGHVVLCLCVTYDAYMKELMNEWLALKS